MSTLLRIARSDRTITLLDGCVSPCAKESRTQAKLEPYIHYGLIGSESKNSKKLTLTNEMLNVFINLLLGKSELLK